MKSSLPAVLFAILLFHPGGPLVAAPVTRNWMILNFRYGDSRPDDKIDPANLTLLSTRPRIYSGLFFQFTRIRLANGESLDVPASHPLRLASGAWRRPEKLKADDRIHYGGSIIRVIGVESVKREPAVRLYVIESKAARDDLSIASGRLTEDPRDLVPVMAEEGYCPAGSCQQRLGLLYEKQAAFTGTAWLYSFIAVQDFQRAENDLRSSSLRSRRKAIEWIQQHGTPEQKARLSLFAHNAGWQGMGLSSAEYYRNLLLLKTEPHKAGTMTALDREILRHDFGREVDREDEPSDSGPAVAEEAAPEIRKGPIVDWAAIGRSALLPGWGNVYLDRPNSGYAYGALFVGSASFAYSEYNRAIVFAAAYKEKSLRADILALALSRSIDRDAMLVQTLYLNQDANNSLKAYRRSANNAINAAQIAGLVYAVSLFHVSTLAVSWPDPEQPDSPASLLIQPGPTGDAVQFAVTVGW